MVLGFAAGLMLAGCAAPPSIVSQDTDERQQFNCPTGDLQCIKDAQKACPNARVLIASTNEAANLTEFSEITPDRPISDETIKGSPTVIVCEDPAR